MSGSWLKFIPCQLQTSAIRKNIKKIRNPGSRWDNDVSYPNVTPGWIHHRNRLNSTTDYVQARCNNSKACNKKSYNPYITTKVWTSATTCITLYRYMVAMVTVQVSQTWKILKKWHFPMFFTLDLYRIRGKWMKVDPISSHVSYKPLQ